jgi:6-phosphogluconolactonase/glucosamine-6-phosphate isomerase/deaminase
MATDTVTKTSPRSTHTAQYLRHTKVPTLMFPNSRDVDRHVALVIESLVRERNSAGLPTVLGLPTGSTPIGVYRELIRLHREEDLDFSRVITFNLDEYWPIETNSIHSYNRWMRETFFDHVNIPEKNIHIPQGNISREDVDAFCDEYERAIEKAGGIDIQLLGIGRTGHIGFNEPGSSRTSRTRLVTLRHPPGCVERLLRRGQRPAAGDDDGGRHDSVGEENHHDRAGGAQGTGHPPGRRRGSDADDHRELSADASERGVCAR